MMDVSLTKSSDEGKAMGEDIGNIAIVGVAVGLPGSKKIDHFWNNVLQGHHINTNHSQSYFSLASGNDHPFGIYLPPPSMQLPEVSAQEVLEVTKKTESLVHALVEEVLQDCYGPKSKSCDRRKISIMLSLTSSSEFYQYILCQLQRQLWENCLQRAGISADHVAKACELISSSYAYLQNNPVPDLIGKSLDDRLTERLGVKSCRIFVDASGISSLTNLSYAVEELKQGNSDLVLSGGIDSMEEILEISTLHPPSHETLGHEAYSGSSPKLEKGMAMLALKRLDDALTDNNTIYALLSDYRQEQIVERGASREMVSSEPMSITEVLGVNAEISGKALKDLYVNPNCVSNTDRRSALSSSISPHIAGSLAASSYAVFLKLTLSLYHRVIPASEIEIQPFSLDTCPVFTSSRPLPLLLRSPIERRRACMSFFGFEGKAEHITLET